MNQTPLAEKMRPSDLRGFIGQKELLNLRGPLRKLIRKDRIPSLILWGPPGCGKTTLARIIANLSNARFINLSAVAAGVAEVKKIIEEARKLREFNQEKTILFLDEIHRFNKAQQDTLLPGVEDGSIILIGATTENPSFYVNSPLLSRAQVITLEALDENDIESIINLALKDKERGLGELKLKIKKDAIGYIAMVSGGDARISLNILEKAADITTKKVIDLNTVKSATTKFILYDKKGEEHYNTISAYIKSIRGSDPDAALHYLARMLEAGDDARFIARRLVILASEDIGNADPHALMVATAAANAVEYVGLPEAQLNLAQATTYLASAPKSNSSYLALLRAKADIKNKKLDPIPLHLRNAVTELMKELNYGAGYKYAHDFKDHIAPKIDFMPKNLKGKRYYYPTNQGFEEKIQQNLAEVFKKRGR
ncbi:MAG: replication-associated recombination protein A [Candidatus Berkelbacteria bacterium]|nr:replication-associated recombination protein A [Candidatus Berkelbacteria bacterium]